MVKFIYPIFWVNIKDKRPLMTYQNWNSNKIKTPITLYYINQSGQPDCIKSTIKLQSIASIKEFFVPIILQNKWLQQQKNVFSSLQINYLTINFILTLMMHSCNTTSIKIILHF